MTASNPPVRKCPTCTSTNPDWHPAVQSEGEVEICVDDFHVAEQRWGFPKYRDQVLAKRAMLAASNPPAVVVPRELTEAMLKAGNDAWRRNIHGTGVVQAYRAMIAAAPQPSVAVESREVVASAGNLIEALSK